MLQMQNMGLSVRRTFLHFADGIDRAGSAATRSRSVNSDPSPPPSPPACAQPSPSSPACAQQQPRSPSKDDTELSTACSTSSVDSSSDSGTRVRIDDFDEPPEVVCSGEICVELAPLPATAVQQKQAAVGTASVSPRDIETAHVTSLAWPSEGSTAASSQGDTADSFAIESVTDFSRFTTEAASSQGDPFAIESVTDFSRFTTEDSLPVLHPSVGSALHFENVCRPCHFIHSKKVCRLGQDCGFCHYKHSKRTMADIPKQTRRGCMQLIHLLHQSAAGSVEETDAKAQLVLWMHREPRLGAYACKALSCFQGPSMTSKGASAAMGLLKAESDARKVTVEASPSSMQNTQSAESTSSGDRDAWVHVSL